ncbi:MAG: hypothetical protein HQM09_21085 [Candidatus Riflebacteria bacterium]|nr:hypothetical protein [Candidatus Riflebacteria bacterium]
MMHLSIPGMELLQMNPVLDIIIGLVLGFIIFWPLSRTSLRDAHAKEKTNLTSHLHDLDEFRGKLEAKNKELTSALEDLKNVNDVLNGRVKAETARNTGSEEKIAKLTQAERDSSAKFASLKNDLTQAQEELNRIRPSITELREKERKLSDLENTHRQTLLDKERLADHKREIEHHLVHLEDIGREQEKRLDEAASRFQAKAADYERAAAELEKTIAERNDLSNRLRDEIYKRSLAEERLLKINVVERENAELRAANLDLKLRNEKMSSQDKQLEEIRNMHEHAFEEINSRRQEQFANRLFEMKRGLERAVSSYNHTVGMLDQRFMVLETPSQNIPRPEQPILVGLNTEDAIQIEHSQPSDQASTPTTPEFSDSFPPPVVSSVGVDALETTEFHENSKSSNAMEALEESKSHETEEICGNETTSASS